MKILLFSNLHWALLFCRTVLKNAIKKWGVCRLNQESQKQQSYQINGSWGCFCSQTRTCLTAEATIQNNEINHLSKQERYNAPNSRYYAQKLMIRLLNFQCLKSQVWTDRPTLELFLTLTPTLTLSLQCFCDFYIEASS